MIEWKQYNKEKPPEAGYYLVFCVAVGFDSDWVDMARFTGERWYSFGNKFSSNERVTHYAPINCP